MKILRAPFVVLPQAGAHPPAERATARRAQESRAKAHEADPEEEAGAEEHDRSTSPGASGSGSSSTGTLRNQFRSGQVGSEDKTNEDHCFAGLNFKAFAGLSSASAPTFR